MTDSTNTEAKKRPAFQFYPGDWRKDVELRACSIAARGLWIDLMCVMHDCEPYGHLMLKGSPMTMAQIGGQIGLTPPQVKKLLDELVANGVARKTPQGAIFSKRMVDDERVRNARAEGGKAGAEHGAKGAEHGNKGGRPKVDKGGSETPLPFDEEPPPSSSSSSSTSVEHPLSPSKGESSAGSKRRSKGAETTLPEWLAAIQAKGEKAVPTDHAVFAYADRIGLPRQFLHLAWSEFKAKHSATPAGSKPKRYTDWRAAFLNAVKGNWLKLWYLDGQQYALTTPGLQAQRDLQGAHNPAARDEVAA